MVEVQEVTESAWFTLRHGREEAIGTTEDKPQTSLQGHPKPGLYQKTIKRYDQTVFPRQFRQLFYLLRANAKCHM